jgi:hypothetical protein
MRQASRLILPCDPGYTAHRDAEKRRQKTRESLRHRERDGVVAPSIVPKGPEKNQRVERKRTYSQ